MAWNVPVSWRKGKVFALISIAILAAQRAPAGELTAAELYTRCYLRLVRKPLPPSDATLAAVRSGSLEARDACLQLFDKAQLAAATGRMVKPDDLEGQAVLRTFHQLHRSWFQSRGYTIDTTTFMRPQALLADMEEPALYYTRAAMLKSARFDSVLTLNQALVGIRVRPAGDVTNFEAQTVFGYAKPEFGDATGINITYTNKTGVGEVVEIPDSALVTSGSLIGIAPGAPIKLPFSARPPIAGTRTALIAAVTDQLTDVDVRRNFGGGIIGSQGFLLSNGNLTVFQWPKDKALINRRVSARVFQDLLCHQLPTLTPDDVTADLKDGVDGRPLGEYPFERSRACMQCHTSLDPMAMNFSNLIFLRAGPVTTGATNSFAFGVNRVASSTDFNLAAHPTKLSFRENITGRLVSEPVSDLSELGRKLALSQDFYLCAAKRYYLFLTGINVPLQPLDTNAPNYTLDKRHQDLVVQLGQRLKSTQSVRALLQMIFETPEFRTRNYRSEVSQ